MNPPETMELARIRMRRPSLADVEAIFEYGSDPEVARYADWPVRTSVDPLVESLRGRSARWESGAEYYWVITLPPEDRAVGGISCCIVQDSAEIGFLLNRRYWGNGLATEAARAIVEWALSIPSIRRVWATAIPKTWRPRACLKKRGLRARAFCATR